MVRAVDAASVRASTWWLVAAGTAVAFGFLTKMGQALLVVPAFGLVYLVAGPTRLHTRLLQLGAALGAMVVAAGWYIALVELWPAADRPYIGGSTHQLPAGARAGLQRDRQALRRERQRRQRRPRWCGEHRVRRVGRDHAPVHRRDRTGGVLAAPAALVLLVAGLAVTLRAPRTDRLRAALVLWGGWTLVTGVVFSFMSGTMHPYYTVALAPGIAALVGIGAVAFWRLRAGLVARGTLALAVAVTAAWAFVLLAGSDETFAWVRWVVLAATVVGVGGLLAGGRRIALAGVTAAVVAGLGAPGAYAVTTAATAHSGPIPSVGTSASAMGGPGGSGGTGQRGGTPPGQTGGATSGGSVTTDGSVSTVSSADAAATEAAGAPPAGGMGGGMGGATSAELTARLRVTTSTWSAAVSSAQSAAGLELASGTAVMATGGWSGSDAAVTLAQFQEAVAQGQIHYYIGGGQGGGPGGATDSTSARIAAWVEANYQATTVGGQTVYDLTT